MNVVFFGSSKFAVPIFYKILESKHEIYLCVTQPDRKKGRGLEIKPTPIKEAAGYEKVKLLQPDDVNTPEVINEIGEYEADVFVVVSFGQILSKSLLERVKYALCVHPSLLPKYRGAAPVNYALLNGEEVTGVTVFRMNEKMDAGEIIDSEGVKIEPDENALELSSRLSQVGANLTVKVLDDIEASNFKLTPQDESRVSYAPKLKKQDGLISWDVPAIVIHNKIRALFPWPGSFTYYIKKGKRQLLKIWESQCYSKEGKFFPGEILDITREGIIVGTMEGSLLVKTVQPSGKQRMPGYAFVQGARLEIGDKFISS